MNDLGLTRLTGLGQTDRLIPGMVYDRPHDFSRADSPTGFRVDRPIHVGPTGHGTEHPKKDLVLTAERPIGADCPTDLGATTDRAMQGQPPD